MATLDSADVLKVFSIIGRDLNFFFVSFLTEKDFSKKSTVFDALCLLSVTQGTA